MRGKKSDPEFVSQFISGCLQRGVVTTEEMVKLARQDIQSIDDKIIEVEKLKITRSKLLDVILTLDKPESKAEEAKLLPFFKLQYPQTCRKICKCVVELGSELAYSITGLKDPEVLFCIKQLLEAKIIARVENHIVRGDKFDEYLTFVLREAK